MNKTHIKKEALILAGLSVRTSNKAEFDSQFAQIAETIKDYFSDDIADDLKARSAPGIFYCAYADYASDEHGEYTFYCGEEVKSSAQDEHIAVLNIPAQKYAVYQSAKGELPNVVVDLWKQIWKMKKADFGGKRAYIADFECYGALAADPKNAIVEISIGVK